MSRRQLFGLWALAAACVAALGARDQVRPWKAWQLAVADARLEFVRLQLDEVGRRLGPELGSLAAALDAAEEAERGSRDEIRDLERELFGLERNGRAASRRLDAAASGSTEEREARIEVESLAEMAADRRRRLEALGEPRRAASASLAAAREPLDVLEDAVRGLAADRWLRSIPGLRYLAPSVGVRASAGERCVTCHLGGRDGLELGGAAPAGFPAVDLAATLGPHPRPDLLAVADPAAGCTGCHGGDPAATALDAAGHIPEDAATAERWRRRWGWRASRVKEPIVTGDRTAAACSPCRGERAGETASPAWRRGLRLAANLRCGACHALDAVGWTPPPVDLSSIAAKTTRSRAMRQLAASNAPADRRMPDFWRTRPDAERAVETAALVEALWRRSQPPSSETRFPAGDAGRGAALFGRLGCGACHVPGAARTGYAGGLGDAAELRPGWLGPFLLDGHRPRLGLAPREAADLSAHLGGPGTTAGDPDVDPDRAFDIDRGVRDRLLLAALEDRGTVEGARAAFEALDDDGRTLRLADLLLERYACAACHTIPGAPPVPRATPLARSATSAAADWLAALGPEGDRVSFEVHADAPAAGSYALDDGERRRLEVVALAAAGGGGPRGGFRVFERHGCRACHEIESAGGDLAPSLDRAAPRLRSGWVESVLVAEAPSARPWLDLRMPSFELTPAEIDAAVDRLAAGGPARSASPTPSPSPRDLAVGRVAFEVLQCGRCHGVGAQAAVVASEADDGWEGLLPVVLAPDYRLTRRRLRPAWLRTYLLAPRSVDPASTLPGIFPELADGSVDSSYLLGALATPMFGVQRERLMRHFDDDRDLARHLSEPDRVAEGLAAYLEALGPPG